MTIKNILIANRGEIAVRIIRTCKAMGILTTAIYSKFDIESLHVQLADRAYLIEGETVSETYLSVNKIISIAKESRADAIHPGYGFLSENHNFAYEVFKNNIILIGPSYKTIKNMGNKVEARKLMEINKVDIIPGTHVLPNLEVAIQKAMKMKFPLLLKASLGGGGRGMRLLQSLDDLKRLFSVTQNEALMAFGCKDIYLEQYILNPKHIEVQIASDKYNNTVAFIERDCSVQRRNQKVIEETPSYSLPKIVREKIINSAIRVAQSTNYLGVGTIEFLVGKNASFYFMEMNTRIQVEHLVTEMISGIDIVEMQINIMNNKKITCKRNMFFSHGHSVEARVYAETPDHKFFPSTGKIEFLHLPGGPFVRVDSGITSDSIVTQYYDPILMKIAAWGDTRNIALRRLNVALREITISGCITNISFLLDILTLSKFNDGTYDIKIIDKMSRTHKSNYTIINYLIASAIKFYSINKSLVN